MFKYNELSDLKDGRLVIPLMETEDEDIICLDENKNEVILSFDDFDFDKTIEERNFIIVDDSSFEERIDEERYEDDSSFEEEIKETFKNSTKTKIPSQHKSGWVLDNTEKLNVLKNISYKSLKDTNVWRDVI